MCAAFIAVLVMAFSSGAYAWTDGKKEGFLLGVHGGYSFTTIERDDYEDVNGSGFLVGPYIGFGLNEQFLLSFRVRYHHTSSNDSDLELYTTMLGGDMMFFLKPDLGLFINAGLARAIAASNTTGEPPWGTIFYAGLGYFFTQNVFGGFDYAVGSFDNDMSTGTISFAVGAMWY